MSPVPLIIWVNFLYDRLTGIFISYFHDSDEVTTNRSMIQKFSVSDPEDVTYPTDYCTVELPAQDENRWGGKVE